MLPSRHSIPTWNYIVLHYIAWHCIAYTCHYIYTHIGLDSVTLHACIPVYTLLFRLLLLSFSIEFVLQHSETSTPVNMGVHPWFNGHNTSPELTWLEWCVTRQDFLFHVCIPTFGNWEYVIVHLRLESTRLSLLRRWVSLILSLDSGVSQHNDLNVCVSSARMIG